MLNPLIVQFSRKEMQSAVRSVIKAENLYMDTGITPFFNFPWVEPNEVVCFNFIEF